MVGRVMLLVVLSVAAHTLVLNAQTAQLGGPPSASTTRFGKPIRDSGFVADFDKCPGRSALSRCGSWSKMSALLLSRATRVQARGWALLNLRGKQVSLCRQT
jgi:hypothetical protein